MSGFCYNFEVSSCKENDQCLPNEPDLGASNNVVRLARVLPTDTNHELYVNNWFNSIMLNIYVFEHSIETVGTVRSNRLGKYPVMSEPEIQKKGRGYLTKHVSNNDSVDISVVS